MQRDHLKDLLDRLPDARAQGTDAWVFSPGTEVSVFVEAGSDLLTVGKVERVELRAHYVVIGGAKGETLFFAHEKIAGLRVDSKVGATSGATSKSPPGFGAR